MINIQYLEENLENLVEKMKNGSYRTNLARRVYIPKETKGKMRPLGIPSYEDKLVENAISKILEQIYEPKFYNESFGFRLNRNCHQAVREIIWRYSIIKQIMRWKRILEASLIM